MNPGDLWYVDVPYHDDPARSKKRVLLVVKELSETEVIVVESRGKPHPHLSLVGIIDFSRRGYLAMPCRGISHFYAENIRNVNTKIFDGKKAFGSLTPQDFKRFFDEINQVI